VVITCVDGCSVDGCNLVRNILVWYYHLHTGDLLSFFFQEQPPEQFKIEIPKIPEYFTVY